MTIHSMPPECICVNHRYSRETEPLSSQRGLRLNKTCWDYFSAWCMCPFTSKRDNLPFIFYKENRISASPSQIQPKYVCTTLFRYSTNFLSLLSPHRVLSLLSSLINKRLIKECNDIMTVRHLWVLKPQPVGCGFCSSPRAPSHINSSWLHTVWKKLGLCGEESLDGLVPSTMARGGRWQDLCHLQSRAVVRKLGCPLDSSGELLHVPSPGPVPDQLLEKLWEWLRHQYF